MTQYFKKKPFYRHEVINCLKLSKWVIFAFPLLFFNYCESISSSSQDRLIARAENHYLYQTLTNILIILYPRTIA